MAGWGNEGAGKSAVPGSLRPLISVRHAGAPLQVGTLGDGHPFPCLGVKVLVGKVGRCLCLFCLFWLKGPVFD